jgi:hypothetical protein
MSTSTLELFLSDSPIALRVPADARIVIRRFAASPAEIGAAVDSGRVEVETRPLCELVVGGKTLARGEITSDGARSHFRVTGVVE